MSKFNLKKLLKVSPNINPRTGRIWSLADDEVQPSLDKFGKKLKKPGESMKFLQNIGILDEHGKLTKRYGG